MKNAAAIILCAGKGTRMNDDSKNKVCFDCAGIPVIKRIIANMMEGGVSRFVIVIGHQAYSVMDCLDGVDGVIYAYQKEQKGTGHAAMCGLKALQTLGYDGPVIVSMGDKIISSDVIRGLLERADGKRAVFGVQPLCTNYNGGRVVVADGKPYGVVEFADAALMSLADIPEAEYETKLASIRLNAKKAAKVIASAQKKKPQGMRLLCGRKFGADEILTSPYANAGLYCFDVKKAVEVIGGIGSDNAQGEIYLTDALEQFAARADAVLYEIPSAEDMLTYSTKPELCEISAHFMRSASEFIKDIQDGVLDENFYELYREGADKQKIRYVKLLQTFLRKYGDKKVVITRSPGRINLMGRHIDHRGGGINVMAIDRDMVFVAAPRRDDTVNIANVDPAYADRRFSIGETLNLAPHDTWLDYLGDARVVEALKESQGDWSNYVKASVLRAQLETPVPLLGMDMVACGNIPPAAGLSSSSSIVVAVMEAVVSLNCLNIPDRKFIELCGEGEWFVGSRGGAGDHAAMKCGKRDSIVHLSFKPFEVGETVGFSDKYAVIVANSMLQAKKSGNARDTFNAKIAAYEFVLMMIKRAYPQYDLREFRDLARIRPQTEIYRMLKSIPETMTRGGVKMLLPEYKERLEQIFSSHAEPKVYDLRGVALYGIAECVRADQLMDALRVGDYRLVGEMMKISHNGDRVGDVRVTDELLDRLIAEEVDISLQCGAYGCSTEQIDGMCDLLNATDGVLGSEIVGAGLGGCVIALVEKEKAEAVISVLNEGYYDQFGYAHAANIYSASSGSSVIF